MKLVPFIVLGLTLAAATAWAVPSDVIPPELVGVGITEKLGASVPLDRTFTDSSGRKVQLREVFSAGRPVILTLNYSNCAMLCSMQLNGLVEGLKGVDLVAGKEFDLVTISIDPNESAERAQQTKERYLKQYGRADAPTAWTFLVGTEENIRAVADAVGFGYKWVEAEKQFAHAAAAILTTADGRIARYVYGIVHEPKTLRLAIIEASQGKVGGAIDQLILYCFHYNPKEGRYTPAVMNILRLGGGVTVLGLMLLIGGYLLAERKRSFA